MPLFLGNSSLIKSVATLLLIAGLTSCGKSDFNADQRKVSTHLDPQSFSRWSYQEVKRFATIVNLLSTSDRKIMFTSQIDDRQDDIFTVNTAVAYPEYVDNGQSVFNLSPVPCGNSEQSGGVYCGNHDICLFFANRLSAISTDQILITSKCQIRSEGEFVIESAMAVVGKPGK